MDDRHPSGGISQAPDEPFPYMSNNPNWAIRSPAFLAAFFAGFTVFSAWAMYSGVVALSRTGGAGALALAIVSISGLALGLYFTYVGIRRWRWKREYERVMGRSPW